MRSRATSNGSILNRGGPNLPPSLELNFVAQTLDPRVTFSRNSAATYVGRHGQVVSVAANAPRLEYAGATGHNYLPNSRWQNVGTNVPPTGWIRPASGTHALNGTINGNNIVRFTAVAQRPFIQSANAYTLAVGQARMNSVYLGTIYSGTATVADLVNWVAAGGAGDQFYFVDGVQVPSNTVATANTRIGVLLVCTTAGALQPRQGVGVGGAMTMDADFSRPQVTGGWTFQNYFATDSASGPEGYSDATPVGLLVEETRVNNLNMSEGGPWSNNLMNVNMPGYFFGEYGGIDVVSGSVAGDFPSRVATPGTPLGTGNSPLVASMYVDLDSLKASGGVAVRVLAFTAAGIVYTGVRLSKAGVVSAGATSGLQSNSFTKVEKVYGNIYRLQAGMTVTDAQTSQPRLYLLIDGGGTQSCVVGMCQLEPNNFASSYIPTAASSVTRLEEDVSYTPTAAIGFRDDEGTFAFTGDFPPVLSSLRLALHVGLLSGERRYLAHDGAGTWSVNVNAGGTSGGATLPSQAVPAIGTAAFTYTGRNYRLTATGPQVVSGTAGGQPTSPTAWRIGRGGSSLWAGHVRSVRYWPRALTPSQLNAVTA